MKLASLALGPPIRNPGYAPVVLLLFVCLFVYHLQVELGDTKSALYEMAQENQKQILKEAKMADRKWEDDVKVPSCSQCHKKFSMTVRRHHCRRCGQIFCQECTQSQAELPGYKGRARVCGICYNELIS